MSTFTLPPSADRVPFIPDPFEMDDDQIDALLAALPPDQVTAVVYERVSTKEQAERGGEAEGFSLPGQRDANYGEAAKLHALVVAEFVEKGESGKGIDRPEIQRLLRFIARHHVTYVIVHKVDRLARDREVDVAITLAIRKAGAVLVSVTENIDETPSGKLVHGIMSSIAEFYSANLATEVVKGSTKKAEGGGTPGKAPIGYLNVRTIANDREARVVEIDPDRGPLMAWAFAQYSTGQWTIRTLLAELTAKGLRSIKSPKRPSKPLNISQLHRHLRNPYYKGHVRYRGVYYAGTHQPLVSTEIWNRVQDVLDAQNTAGERQRTHHHYLKGTVYCGHCESRLIVSEAKNRHGTIYRYFLCIGRQQKRTTCTQAAMRIEHVEALVEDYYATIGLTADRVQALRTHIHDGLSAQRADAELDRRSHQALLTRLDNERRKLLQAHYDEAIAPDLFRTEQQRITREMETATARLDTMAQLFVDIGTNLDHALALGQDCRRTYLAASPNVRRRMNQAFYERLYINDDETVTSELAEPFAILLGDQLTTEVEAALAAQAKNPPPETGPTGPATTSDTHTQHVEGLNKRLWVDLTGLEP